MREGQQQLEEMAIAVYFYRTRYSTRKDGNSEGEMLKAVNFLVVMHEECAD